MHSLDDTIVAIASPPGGAARGIVRLSGPKSVACLQRFFVSSNPSSNENAPRILSGDLRLPSLASPLPCEAWIWPVGRSYTGQSVVEVHTIGSPPLLELLVRSFCTAGARPAHRGEFTLRAFLTGRIDLTQAEAVLGVIDADDPDQLQTALEQLAGGLARPLHRLRNELLDLLAQLEAGFDFADEDLTFITRPQLEDCIARLRRQVTELRRQMNSRGESIETFRVVLTGRPNVGKSSLFNALAGRPTALIANRPGTTRDYLAADLDLEGLKCRLIDTAGIANESGKTSGPNGEKEIERMAASHAVSQRAAADIEILCLDATQTPDAWERRQLIAESPRQIVVQTKCDLAGSVDATGLATSSATGLGIATLREQLRERLTRTGRRRGASVAVTAARSADSLRQAGRSLRRAQHVVGQEELAAVELRTALTELGKIVGTVYTDDVLDRIFSRFCIGK
ncbi:MAG: tRNA modification GTPase [Planctomycetaceae bacterium]|nr:tRNA modification GTPase [Planctomycetaceae bacterium]